MQRAELVNADERFDILTALLSDEKPAEAAELLTDLHPADKSALLVRLDDPQRLALFAALGPETRAELFEHLPEELAAELAATLSTDSLAEALDEVSPEIAADILQDIPAEQADPALEQMADPDPVRSLLDHRDDTAGGIMTPDFVALHGWMTIQQGIDFLRQSAADPSTPYYLYVIDEQRRLIGILGLRDVIVAQPDARIDSVMSTKVHMVTEGTDQEEVARMMSRYSLTSLPVVNGDGMLTGVITTDELVTVIEEEATEDMFRLSNVADGYVQLWCPLRTMIRTRLPWLYLNLLMAFLAASVVNLFEGTIAKLAVLASLQGIVSGQGGNAATQILAIMVRGIAMNEVRTRDAWRALRREIVAGAMNGIAIGSAVGAATWWWKGSGGLGAVIALAMVGNMVAAAFAGTLVPLGLKALRLDPALASAVMVTTVTDCMGFGLFLGLATICLPYI